MRQQVDSQLWKGSKHSILLIHLYNSQEPDLWPTALACTYEVVDVLGRISKQACLVLLCAWLYVNAHLLLCVLSYKVLLPCVEKKIYSPSAISSCTSSGCPVWLQSTDIFRGGSLHSSLSSCIFLRPLSSFSLCCWPNSDEILALTALLSWHRTQHTLPVFWPLREFHSSHLSLYAVQRLALKDKLYMHLLGAHTLWGSTSKITMYRNTNCQNFGVTNKAVVSSC